METLSESTEEEPSLMNDTGYESFLHEPHMDDTLKKSNDTELPFSIHESTSEASLGAASSDVIDGRVADSDSLAASSGVLGDDISRDTFAGDTDSQFSRGLLTTDASEDELDEKFSGDAVTGNSDLHLKAMDFNVNAVKDLLDSGASVSRENKKQRSPLHEMTISYVQLHPFDQEYERESFVQILTSMVQAGLDVNLGDVQSKTSLHYLVDTSRTCKRIITALKASGTKVNIPDKYQQTALHLATSRANFNNVQALMEAGADLDVQDQRGRTPLHLAALGSHHSSILEFFLKIGASVNVRDKSGQTPLHLAARHSRCSNITALLMAGANVHQKDTSGQSSLHLATAHDTTGKALGLLIRNCSDLNRTDDIYNETCLHKAVRLQMWHNLKLLTRGDIDVNIQDSQGETPLHKAYNCTQVYVWITLMKLGADITIANNYCQTPVQKAARAKNLTATSVIRQFTG